MPLTNKTLFFFLFFFISAYPRHNNATFVIMLDPSGDAHDAGRTIDDSFERGITLQYAENIKRSLETDYPFVRVLLTRLPGDFVYELQNATYANRLGTHLFISLHFYKTTETKPHIDLYQFSYNNDFISPNNTLTFYHYDQAHLSQLDKSRAWGHLIKSALQNQYQHIFTIRGIYKLPFKPLIGVSAPALGIEIGLKHKEKWQEYVEPIAYAIGKVIETT